VNDDLGDDAVPDPVNPLRRPLEPVELDLLETIWDPISRETAPWPVWDYVSRTLYTGASEVHDAAAVLAALPTVPAGPGAGEYAAPYGLVWRSHAGPDVSGEEHVGLTIAGLVRLAERRAPLKVLADRLTGVISALAAAERDTFPDPLQAVRPQIPLDLLVRNVTVRTLDFLTPVPVQAVVDLLQHEHALIGIVHGAEPPQASPTVYLRPYARLNGAEDYLDRIGLMTQRRQLPAPVRRGEELLQTLDYVSYVLAAHPSWKPAGRMAVVQDLETAAILAADAGNQVEFDHRLSALATLLDGLNTPEPTPEALQRHWTDPNAPKSLSRLEIWIKETLQDDARRRQALDAVKVIKAVKDLRNRGQHSGTGPRRKATQACGRLGIDEPIREPGQAWEIVRARVADAFDTIRREVVSGP
jgi:hypothetical protein